MTSATVFPDTTILIQYKPLNLVDWKALLGVDTIKLILAPSVIQEIKDIKNQDISSNLATRAAITLQTIERLQAESQADASLFKLYFPDEPEIDFKAEGLDPNSVADLLVATIVDYQSHFALEYTTLFTEDHETSVKALAAGVEVRNLPKMYRVDFKASSPQTTERSSHPITSSLTPERSIPLSNTLSTPSPLFKQSEKEESKKQEQPEKQEQVEKKESPTPLLSLSDIGLNGIKLPDTTKKKNGLPPAEKSVPIINIIQEPARPDSTPVSSPHQAKEEPEKESEQVDSAVEENNEPVTPVDKPTPTVTHSFSFVSQKPSTPTPSEPPKQNSFIPTEINYEKADLRLSVGEEDEYRTTVVIHHPIYPSLDDVNNHLSTVRTNFPKLSLPYEAGGDGLGSDLLVTNLPYGSVAPDTILQRKAQRIKKYNSSLDTYYSGIEKYLSDNAEFDNFKRRSAKIDLSLFNDLPEDLKSLYISIHFQETSVYIMRRIFQNGQRALRLLKNLT